MACLWGNDLFSTVVGVSASNKHIPPTIAARVVSAQSLLVKNNSQGVNISEDSHANTPEIIEEHPKENQLALFIKQKLLVPIFLTTFN